LGILLLIALYFLGRPFLQPSEDQPSTRISDASATAENPASSAGTPRRVTVQDQADGAVEKPAGDVQETRRLGELEELDGGIKRSTAGLLYTPGSQEGHRLEHVLRHDNDIPSRPGKHGVFDGDDSDLLAVIDEAYLLVREGSPRVQSQREGRRTVHNVDIGRRIGFVGGQDGARDGNPSATHVRLVLEEDRLITAFPY
jgi:hypothetical protein